MNRPSTVTALLVGGDHDGDVVECPNGAAVVVCATVGADWDARDPAREVETSTYALRSLHLFDGLIVVGLHPSLIGDEAAQTSAVRRHLLSPLARNLLES